MLKKKEKIKKKINFILFLYIHLCKPLFNIKSNQTKSVSGAELTSSEVFIPISDKEMEVFFHYTEFHVTKYHGFNISTF